MGRKSLTNQIDNILYKKQGFGESRHEAKQQMRETLGDKYRFGMADDKIHSYETFNTYRDACHRFATWLVEEKDIKKYSNIQDCKEYAKEYLLHRLNDEHCSVWTVKTERSALGKLYGEQIEVTLPKRDVHDITRSRMETESSKHFSETRNRELVDMARATGCRRSDLQDLRPRDFWKDEKGNLWVDIDKSKGGRDRSAPVLPRYKEFVEHYISDKAQHERLFPKINNNADIHSYRGEYARELYAYVRNHTEYKEQILSAYPTRHEYKTIKDKETGERITREITSKTITTRGADRQTYNRDDVYIVSQALGHNRLDVSITHYLKN